MIIFSEERRWQQKVHGLKPVRKNLGLTEEKYFSLPGTEFQGEPQERREGLQSQMEPTPGAAGPIQRGLVKH